MKWQVIRFSGINLSKVSAIRKSLPNTIVCCRTSNDLQINLKKLARRLDLQIGENYMKRSRYYVLACIAGLILSFIGLIGANSDVSLKDLVTLNFVFDIPRIKGILTNIFSTMIVFSATLFFFAIGFAKKQREDVSQIKKYALYELLLSVKMQHSQLVDYPPIDEPADLFCAYVHNVYEVRAACDKVLAAYENLLTTWEQETLKNLQHSAMVLSEDFGISAENFREYSATQFCIFYDEKVRTAPQNEKINVFTHKIKTDIEKYRTNNSLKNKQYRDEKVRAYFLMLEAQGLCVTSYANTTRRFNQEICDFINTIHGDADSMVEPDPNNQQEMPVENSGVYMMNVDSLREYCEYYHPIILRYDKKANGFQHDCDVFNYGGSKGATYERVVIIPVSTTLPFIERQVKITSNQTRAKFYVACTRAKHSVVFAMENPCENGVFKATDIHFSDKSIPAYKFSKPDSDI